MTLIFFFVKLFAFPGFCLVFVIVELHLKYKHTFKSALYFERDRHERLLRAQRELQIKAVERLNRPIIRDISDI